MKELFWLNVDDMRDLETSFRRNGWTKDDLRRLIEGDFLSKIKEVFLGNAQLIPHPLLEFIGVATLPSVGTPFVVSDHFIEDLEGEGVVHISFIDENFRRWFFGKTLSSVPAREVVGFRLRKWSRGPEIIRNLGGPVKSALEISHIWSLLKAQPKGERGGILSVDGSSNVFWISSLAVFVLWTRDGWEVNATVVEGEDGWNMNDQVFATR